MQNRELIAAWADWATDKRRLRTRTVETYMPTFEELLKYLGPTALQEATLQQLEAFIGRPRRRIWGDVIPLAAPATLKREISQLRSLWDWMHARGLVHTNPARMMVAPTVHNENPKPTPDSEWRAIWGAALTDEQRVAFGLGYYCGLRRADIVRIRGDQVKWTPEPMLANVEVKGGKLLNIPWGRNLSLYHERRPDLLPSIDTFVAPLRRLIEKNPGGLLFDRWTDDGLVNPNNFAKHLTRVCDRLGFHTSPHQLRHAYVTNLIDMGVGLERTSRLAGHANVTTTMRYVSTGKSPLDDVVGLAADFDGEAARTAQDRLPRFDSKGRPRTEFGG